MYIKIIHKSDGKLVSLHMHHLPRVHELVVVDQTVYKILDVLWHIEDIHFIHAELIVEEHTP
jgi:hypothetical protein